MILFKHVVDENTGESRTQLKVSPMYIYAGLVALALLAYWVL